MEFRYDPQARRLRMRALVPAGHHVEKFVAADQFKFGVEEEYFLSDAKTFEVPTETPDELFETADFGDNLTPELREQEERLRTFTAARV